MDTATLNPKSHLILQLREAVPEMSTCLAAVERELAEDDDADLVRINKALLRIKYLSDDGQRSTRKLLDDMPDIT